MTLEDRLQRLSNRTPPGDPAEVLAAARAAAESRPDARSPRLLPAAAAAAVLAVVALVAGGLALTGGDEPEAVTTAGPGTDNATVAVSVIGLPSVEASTSPLTPSARAWLQHTVTLRNTGTERVTLTGFVGGESLGDDELAVATEGCTFSGSPNIACLASIPPPVEIEPGGTHEFTVTLWRDLPAMNPVTDATYSWNVPVRWDDRPDDRESSSPASLVTITYENLVNADAPVDDRTDPATGSLRVESIRVVGNGPRAGGTERAVINFNAPLPAGEVRYIAGIASADAASGMAWTTQGPTSTHLCDSQHSVPETGVGSVDLLVPAAWFADGDEAHTGPGPETIDDPAKFPICGPHNGFIQYSMWMPLSADPADVTVTVSSDRRSLTISTVSTSDLGGVDGPVLYGPEQHGAMEGALLSGRLLHEGDCLYLLQEGDEALYAQFVVVWPNGATWQDSAEGVQLADGTFVPVGATVTASGGFDDVDSLVERGHAPAVAERARACAFDNIDTVAYVQGEVTVADNEWRTVELLSFEELDANSLEVTLSYCGDNFRFDVEETPETVTIRAETSDPEFPPAPDCATAGVVTLESPLGSRQVIDAATGAAMEQR